MQLGTALTNKNGQTLTANIRELDVETDDEGSIVGSAKVKVGNKRYEINFVKAYKVEEL